MAILLFFIFAALGSFVNAYILLTELKTWFEAQNYCREHYSDLATISNVAQNDLMTTLGEVGFAWIGLYDNATKWMWSIGNTDLKSTGFTNWGSSNPDYYTVSEEETKICVSMENGGLWNDRRCEDSLTRVCYQDPNVYTLGNSPSSWQKAQMSCRSLNKDLPSVRDMTENAAVDDVTSKANWIGLYRHTWVNWSDTSFSTFSNWDNNMNLYLNQSAAFHCAMFNTKTGTWFRSSCDSKRPFICNSDQSYTGSEGKGPGHGVTLKLGYINQLKLNLKTDANLSDAAIYHQILQQIHAKMEEHDISNFELGWTQTDGPNFAVEPRKKKKKKC